MSGVVLPKISEPPTSESLRLRVLAYLNGAPSSEELRKTAVGGGSRDTRSRQGPDREPRGLRRLPALRPGALGCRPRARQHLARHPLEALQAPAFGSWL
jgi:hypothetical protein